jgi:carbon monoxide dehydrogenase subunit G
MASIHREVLLDAPLDAVWDALRDVGALHTRLVPGFVTATRLEDGARIVTFANGMVAKELIVDIDEAQRRVCWAAVGTAMSHHNASFQLFAEAARTRGVWIADLLPHALAPNIAAMIEQALVAMQRHFATPARAAA